MDRLAGPASIDESAPARAATLRVAVDATARVRASRASHSTVTRSRPMPRPAVRSTLRTSQPGEHRLTLDDAGGDELAATDVDLRDLLVVSLGDSVASGEGNPDGPGAPLAGAALPPLAALGRRAGGARGRAGDRHSVVTFVPLACSGATIDVGLLGAYDGVQPEPPPRPAAAAGRRARPAHDGRSTPCCSASAPTTSTSVRSRSSAWSCATAGTRRFDPAHPLHEAGASFPTAAEVERTRPRAPASRLRPARRASRRERSTRPGRSSSSTSTRCATRTATSAPTRCLGRSIRRRRSGPSATC